MWDYMIVAKLIKPNYNIMRTMIIYIQYNLYNSNSDNFEFPADSN